MKIADALNNAIKQLFSELHQWFIAKETLNHEKTNQIWTFKDIFSLVVNRSVFLVIEKGFVLCDRREEGKDQSMRTFSIHRCKEWSSSHWTESHEVVERDRQIRMMFFLSRCNVCHQCSNVSNVNPRHVINPSIDQLDHQQWRSPSDEILFEHHWNLFSSLLFLTILRLAEDRLTQRTISHSKRDNEERKERRDMWIVDVIEEISRDEREKTDADQMDGGKEEMSMTYIHRCPGLTRYTSGGRERSNRLRVKI